MKVNVLVPCEIELKPGDRVVLYNVWEMYGGFKKEVHTTIKRIVESKNLTYCSFDGCYAYRPISTYGITWKKVD